MRKADFAIKLPFLLALAMSCVPAPAAARQMQVKVAAVRTGAATLAGVRMTLDWPEGAGQGSLRLQADLLEVPTLAYRGRRVDWQCPLLRAGDGWRCVGPVRTGQGPPMPLALAISPAMTQAELRIGARRLAYETRAAAPDLARIRVERIPVDWLQGFLAAMWPAGHWTQGSLSGQVDVATPTRGPFQVTADLDVAALALETPDGLVAAAGLSGKLRVDYRDQGGALRVEARAQLRGGELLAQDFYAVLPATPVDVRVVAERAGSEPWRLPQFEWRDPGTLVATGSAVLDAQASPVALDTRIELADLSVARDRYLSGFLGPAGFADLLMTGRADARLRLEAAAPSAIDVHLQGLNAVDSKGRFTFADIGGDLHWAAHGAAPASALAWQSGAIYGIGLGPARYRFSSADGEVRLEAPVAIDVLEGKLTLDHFRWRPPSGANGARFELGMGMDRLDLGSLSQRLGWPPFTGTIGGSIPSAHYQDNVLTLDGGLRMALFEGSVQIDDLVMERPFGVAPTLSANVGIQDIDLEPMTKVFGFGSITGRLDGHINHLRLVDWAPAAFEARLETDRQWKGKRRISQRAVKDISSVGGSGLIAGVQAKLLGIFSDFGYDRIGIGCTLHDNVCRMDGLDSAGAGYIIVAGAGLPRIQVVGFRRQVDWPTLVARLKAATEGQAPVID